MIATRIAQYEMAYRMQQSVPELADVCNLETEKLYGVFSENMGPTEWVGLAEAIGREIEQGVDGIVVSNHGGRSGTCLTRD